jgi:hypothetical protein
MGLIPYLEIDKEEKLVIVQEILPIEQAHKNMDIAEFCFLSSSLTFLLCL